MSGQKPPQTPAHPQTADQRPLKARKQHPQDTRRPPQAHRLAGVEHPHCGGPPESPAASFPQVSTCCAGVRVSAGVFPAPYTRETAAGPTAHVADTRTPAGYADGTGPMTGQVGQ